MNNDIPVVDEPLFFLDYDGTLAPIVDDPAAAYPHEAVPDLLNDLEEQYPVWIVTGRHLRDLPKFLDIALPAIGLHGAQEGVIGQRIDHLLSDEAEQALDRFRQTVPDIEGLSVEDKEKSFAVHYRSVSDPQQAKERLAEWIDDLPGVIEPVWGKKVLELRAKGLNKGTAVRRVSAEYPDHTPVYIGDDVTDEDAFEALYDNGVTVKVGNGESSARYHLEAPKDVVAYLRQYV